jgi:hypothetical protein
MQGKKKRPIEQFQYCERWVNKENFRAFVYDINGNKKLANSYDEFFKLTSSGIWFEKKPELKNIEEFENKENTENTDLKNLIEEKNYQSDYIDKPQRELKQLRKEKNALRSNGY